MNLTGVDSEKNLIDRCLRGELPAFRELYEIHKEVMYNVAFRLHRNKEDAEDSLQEAFVKIYRFLPDFQRTSKLSTWIYKIVVNTCLNRIRRDSHRKEVRLENYPDGDSLLPTERKDWSLEMILEEEIDRLPEGGRTVFDSRRLCEKRRDRFYCQLDLIG